VFQMVPFLYPSLWWWQCRPEQWSPSSCADMWLPSGQRLC
jgi:hypothetical protein